MGVEVWKGVVGIHHIFPYLFSVELCGEGDMRRWGQIGLLCGGGCRVAIV